MDYALSFQDGREYLASTVTYERAKKLKLICPVCHEKVFKKVRNIPDTCHFFCHHKGGSPDCELYHPSQAVMGNGDSTTRSQGQDFTRFVKSVLVDIRELLLDSGAIQEPLDAVRFARIERLSEEYEFDSDRESLTNVEAQSRLILTSQGHRPGCPSHPIIEAISGFHRRRSARFIDGAVCTWTVYATIQNREIRVLKRTMKSLVSDSILVDAISSVFLAGLAAKYSKSDTKWFRVAFQKFCREFTDTVFRKETGARITTTEAYQALVGDLSRIEASKRVQPATVTSERNTPRERPIRKSPNPNARTWRVTSLYDLQRSKEVAKTQR